MMTSYPAGVAGLGAGQIAQVSRRPCDYISGKPLTRAYESSTLLMCSDMSGDFLLDLALVDRYPVTQNCAFFTGSGAFGDLVIKCDPIPALLVLANARGTQVSLVSSFSTDKVKLTYRFIRGTYPTLTL